MYLFSVLQSSLLLEKLVLESVSLKPLGELKLWSAGYRAVHRRDWKACPPDEPGKAGLMIKSLPGGWISAAFLSSTT